MKTNCLNCGNKNPKHGMKTCSKKCCSELQKINSREKRNCLVCKVEFEVRKKHTKKICSEECRKKWASLPENISIRITAHKEAIKKKYGVDNIFQLESTKEKLKKTKLEKYGDEYYNNPEKNKLTTFERYGVYHAIQNDEVKKKVKKTIKERFGVESVLQNEDIKNKIKKTTKDRFGVDNISQNENIKQKKKDTSIKNFGVSHHLKDGEMFNKHQKAMFKVKTYKDSDIYYNGSYEKYFLELMEEKGLLSEVSNGDSFVYISKEKEHTYHVDFKFRGRQIEIKSTWTYNKNGKDQDLQDINEAKWNSARESGADFIVLMDKSEVKGFVKSL